MGSAVQKDFKANEQLFVLEFYADELPYTEHDSHSLIPGPFPVHSPSFLAISLMISTKEEGFESLCLHQIFLRISLDIAIF